MFLGLDPVLYIWGYLFIVYVMLITLIVLYSRCRVNRSTNLSVVLYNVIYYCFASTAFGLSVGRSQPVGCVLHHAVCSMTSGFGARMAQMSEDELLKRTTQICQALVVLLEC